MLDELYEELYALAKEYGITDPEIEGMLLANEDYGMGAEESAKDIIRVIKSGEYDNMKEILSGIDSKKLYEDVKTLAESAFPYYKKDKKFRN